jgi:hypothetical protein
MNGRQSFTPDEFVGRLKRDEIRVPIILYGMVKPAEDSDEYLMFAHGSVCENWIRIRLNSIETIELQDFISCDGHAHPLVLLVLRQPETDEGQLFASLVFRDQETMKAKGTPNPCRECIRMCYKYIDDAETFRDCARNCPC